MHFEKRPALQSIPDGVILAQALGFRDYFGEAAVGGDDVCLEIFRQASAQREIRRRGFEKIGVEAFVGVEPVVVAGNRIDRFGEAFERQIEIGFIVLHLAVRINDITGQDQKPD